MNHQQISVSYGAVEGESNHQQNQQADVESNNETTTMTVGNKWTSTWKRTLVLVVVACFLSVFLVGQQTTSMSFARIPSKEETINMPAAIPAKPLKAGIGAFGAPPVPVPAPVGPPVGVAPVPAPVGKPVGVAPVPAPVAPPSPPGWLIWQLLDY